MFFFSFRAPIVALALAEGDILTPARFLEPIKKGETEESIKRLSEDLTQRRQLAGGEEDSEKTTEVTEEVTTKKEEGEKTTEVTEEVTTKKEEDAPPPPTQKNTTLFYDFVERLSAKNAAIAAKNAIIAAAIAAIIIAIKNAAMN